MSLTIRMTEHFHGGCSVTWDAVARAGYAHTNPNPDAFRVASTVVASPYAEHNLLVDLDDEGFVRGVETIGHEVGIADLLAVLRNCRWTDT